MPLLVVVKKTLFQGLARLMVILNVFLPLFSYGAVFTENSPGIYVCLGEGYNLFFTTEIKLCNYDDLFAKIACLFWLVVQTICMSNIVDIYCICCCVKEIKKSTEETKNMLTKQAYTNRKR